MSLSPREQQVMIMVCQGYIVGQIAGKLSISKSTVKTYRARILDKLRADCMEVAILRSHRLRIIDLDTIPDVFVPPTADCTGVESLS